jgi:hypothetical protein
MRERLLAAVHGFARQSARALIAQSRTDIELMTVSHCLRLPRFFLGIGFVASQKVPGC